MKNKTNAENSSKKLKTLLNQVNSLLTKHKLVDDLISKQENKKRDLVETIARKQNLVELERKLEELHPADIADILEALPIESRLVVWELIKVEQEGDVLLEVSDAVRDSLISEMNDQQILAAAKVLDPDELADLAPQLSKDVLDELMVSLDSQKRERMQSALSYDEDQVGAIMDFELITIRDVITLKAVSRYLRRFKELPSHTDKLFVINKKGVFQGVLPIKQLLVNSPDNLVINVMSKNTVSFYANDDGYQAAQAFERYDLISAPVVDSENRLIGRLTIDEMVDLIQEESTNKVLGSVGLKEEEDLFASVWKSVRNRWAWLAINLVTAILASRVIGMFEGSIEKLVALAALMPIVAGIGGNSGNQTLTMIVRAMALDQIQSNSVNQLLKKELGVALINGIIWGGVIGLIACFLYESWSLGVVMTAAMICTPPLKSV